MHTIGRGLTCIMRLNDVTVSREHLRLDVRENEIHAIDLGSRNGTLINGQICTARRALRDGDLLQIGEQQIRIRVLDRGPLQEPEPFDEETRDRQDLVRAERPTPDRLPAIAEGKNALSTPRISFLDCPKCRGRVPAEQHACPSCGYHFPRGGPLFTTQVLNLSELKPSGAERRSEPRVAVELLLLYVSESLSLSAVARDLGMGGVYVATDLLDEVGTVCNITFLPEGRSAVQCQGMVRHVSNSQRSDGRPPGMGVQFTQLGSDGKNWLSSVISSQVGAPANE